jgi:hypothetical protein
MLNNFAYGSTKRGSVEPPSEKWETIKTFFAVCANTGNIEEFS